MIKNNNPIFDRIPNYIILLTVVTIIFFKIIVYISLKNNFISLNVGGGNDADYYNAYANGLTNVAVNTWPIILRYLNNIGLYSREGMAYFMLFLSLIVIPILVCKLAGFFFKSNQQYYLYGLLIVLLYPTMYFYSLDIYRDVFMVFVFLVSCLMVKKFVNSKDLLSLLFYMIVSLMMGFILLGLRPYLGYAFLLSLLLWKIKFTKKRLIFFGILYFILLFIANYTGLLEGLTEYRAGFKENSGSTLGLDFSNPVLFIPNFIVSFLGQMLGLYITNPLAVFLLLVETIPFFFMLIYVIKNIKLADNFVRFLVIFFVIYASVWLIGNDNLGTAVRLRLYNYFAIYISFFYILRIKFLALNSSEV